MAEKMVVTLRPTKFGICPGCGNTKPLIEHHWFEDGDHKTKQLCQGCNRSLATLFNILIGKTTHNGPTWKTQLEYLKTYNTPTRPQANIIPLDTRKLPLVRKRTGESLIPTKCLRCGHIWFPRVRKPIQCPECKNPNWNRKW